VYVGATGSEMLARIRRALKERKEGTDLEIAQELFDQYEAPKPLTAHGAARLVRRSRVAASIRYGTKTLVEHFVEGTDEGLEAVAVRRMPDLTEAERAALEQAPIEMSELNLLPNGSCCDNVTDIVQVVIAVTFALLCAGPGFKDLHISESRLESMTPVMAAIELMDIRREALGHSH
jgi:hypothetical protein